MCDDNIYVYVYKFNNTMLPSPFNCEIIFVSFEMNFHGYSFLFFNGRNSFYISEN